MSADLFAEFRTAMLKAGITPPDSVIADGELHRFATNGKASDDAGWYVLYVDGLPAGAFGDFRTGAEGTWCSDRPESLSESDRARQRENLRKAQRERDAEKERRQAQAAERAREIWAGCTPAPTDHAYLARKRLQAHGLGLYRGQLVISEMPCDGALVVPLRDAAGELPRSLEFVAADGEKRYLPGASTAGLYYTLGAPGDTLVVCEGWATGAAVHEAAGLAVCCAMSAGNLRAVAQTARARAPSARIVVAADNDEGGAGQRAAEDAARAIGGFVALPEHAGTDWCDVRLSDGDDAVRAGIEAAREPGSDAGGTGGAAGEAPDIKAVRQRIAELAKLSRIEYELIRNAEAEALGLRTSILDAEVAALHASDTGPGLAFSDPGSWPDTVDGAVLLEELRGTIERYVVLPAHAAVAIALWTLHAWAYDAFYGSPYLLIRSPQKRCGKTTLLTVLRPLVRRPLIATSVSTSVIYRAIEQYQPTLVLDEVDAWMRENEEMRAVLCGGTTRSTARVLRIGGENRDEIQAFSTFCPKVFAGIGRLVDTLEDRSIIVKMQRKRATDRVVRLREDQFERGVADTQSRCRKWSEDQLEALRGADPRVPPALNDRAADNWRPLLAIADMAGGDWPRLAREAAIALSGQTDDEAAGVQLLADIREVFKAACKDRLESEKLAQALGAMEERPWIEWKHGKPITAPQLARLLKPFEIAPRNIAVGDRRPKGYQLWQFEDAFSRYLAPEPSESATGEPEAF